MLPKEIAEYYREVAEEARLTTGPSQLEFARTKEIVLRYLPSPPATILDVGAAAGAYSLWLAESGYQVHIVGIAKLQTGGTMEEALATIGQDHGRGMTTGMKQPG
jgi:2-polyprenyl-3-methyl-5-hydroxy-6-metoxy-1,4-benzoquinol methylase